MYLNFICHNHCALLKFKQFNDIIFSLNFFLYLFMLFFLSHIFIYFFFIYLLCIFFSLEFFVCFTSISSTRAVRAPLAVVASISGLNLKTDSCEAKLKQGVYRVPYNLIFSPTPVFLNFFNTISVPFSLSHFIFFPSALISWRR